MSFQINQRVLYPVFGLGRITGRVTKDFFGDDTQEFYEVAGEHSTVWVQVSEAATRGLRALTQPAELPHYRAVLRGKPADLSPDERQRHRDISARLKRGKMQDLCEIVRDLSARSCHAQLSVYDLLGLNKSRQWLCEEWAVADGISLAQATAEITGLLLEARRAYPA
jgi:RNA polymerase-interacting CarD/CdnL/TRCF family regulator